MSNKNCLALTKPKNFRHMWQVQFTFTRYSFFDPEVYKCYIVVCASVVFGCAIQYMELMIVLLSPLSRTLLYTI